MNVKVWLNSGKFESSISIPLNHTDEERKLFIETWLELMVQGVRLGSKL